MSISDMYQTPIVARYLLICMGQTEDISDFKNLILVCRSVSALKGHAYRMSGLCLLLKNYRNRVLSTMESHIAYKDKKN